MPVVMSRGAERWSDPSLSFLSLPRGEEEEEKEDADFCLPSGQGDLRGCLPLCDLTHSLCDPLVHLQGPRPRRRLNR